MTGPKLNEAPVIRRRPESRAQAVTAELPSTRAVARHMHVSPYKVREVLDLIRGHEVQRAQDILRLCERDAAIVVGKLLASAMANAEHNHALVTDELFVSACYADEGPTLKRWRPRARGRATRIRKRTCHVTVIVSRLPEAELRQRRAQRAQATSGRRGGARRAAAGGGGRPDRAGTGRGRRRDESSTSTSGSTTPATKGVDTGSFSTPPAAPEAEPKAHVTESEVPTPMAENDNDTPNPDAITETPEVRSEGPASGDAANEATEADASEDDSSSDDAEDKE
ncbi:MAG: large subunit ribosomal protein [Actinomycetota bacterium]|jgi:large subunit ribosomal protein L22|nr:large subunit ribosomal protein [Actinomycetota bacterium]